VLFELMVNGAVGWFAGYPNAFPKEAVELYDLCAAGEWLEAKALYEQLVAVFRWDSRTEFVQAIKLSMDICGNSYGGPTRPPRGPLSTEQHAQVTADTERALAALAVRAAAVA
jgi:dihydrodipicolinate synthase/N-acetylneuraminate lyase